MKSIDDIIRIILKIVDYITMSSTSKKRIHPKDITNQTHTPPKKSTTSSDSATTYDEVVTGALTHSCRTISDGYECGLNISAYSHQYERSLAMHLFAKEYLQSSMFNMGIEVSQAEKFDKIETFLLQVKHFKDVKKISSKDFFHIEGRSFDVYKCIKQYFHIENGLKGKKLGKKQYCIITKKALDRDGSLSWISIKTRKVDEQRDFSKDDSCYDEFEPLKDKIPKFVKQEIDFKEGLIELLIPNCTTILGKLRNEHEEIVLNETITLSSKRSDFHGTYVIHSQELPIRYAHSTNENILQDNEFVLQLNKQVVEQKCLPIVGELGMGKTTFMSYISYGWQMFNYNMGNLKQMQKRLQNSLKCYLAEALILFDSFNDVSFTLSNVAFTIFKRLFSSDRIRLIISGRYNVQSTLKNALTIDAIGFKPLDGALKLLKSFRL